MQSPHARLATVPLALIFQRRHSVRQQPCHCPFPGGRAGCGSQISPLTFPPHRRDTGKHSNDLKVKLLLPCPPFPGGSPPLTASIRTDAAAAISREVQEKEGDAEGGGGNAKGRLWEVKTGGQEEDE